MVPGTYNAAIEGYFVLIKGLDKGTYQLHLGGRGRGNARGVYQTDAIYEITVTDKYLHRNFVLDVSNWKEGGPPNVPLPPAGHRVFIQSISSKGSRINHLNFGKEASLSEIAQKAVNCRKDCLQIFLLNSGLAFVHVKNQGYN